jgi:hypothetical protein
MTDTDQDNDLDENTGTVINEAYFLNASAKRKKIILDLIDEYQRLKHVQSNTGTLQLRVLFNKILEHEERCFASREVTTVGRSGLDRDYDHCVHQTFIETIKIYRDLAQDYPTAVAIFERYCDVAHDEGKLKFPDDFIKKLNNTTVRPSQALTELLARDLMNPYDIGERLAHWQMRRITQVYYGRSSADMSDSPHETHRADAIFTGKPLPEIKIYSRRKIFADRQLTHDGPTTAKLPPHNIVQIIGYIDHIFAHSLTPQSLDHEAVHRNWQTARTLYGSTKTNGHILIAPGIENRIAQNEIPSLSLYYGFFVGSYIAAHIIPNILPMLLLQVPNDAYSHYHINYNGWHAYTAG